MKKIAFVIILLFTGWSNVSAQGLPVDTETKKITYQETVTLDSVSRDDLYQRTKDWIANFYKTDKYSPDDKANYKVGKDGSFEIQLTYDFKYKSQNNVSYSILIGQKEGKYRFTITDFKIYNVKLGEKTAQSLEAAIAKMSGQNKNETVTQVNKNVNDVITDLKKFMTTGKPENKEDW
ncbi:MAG TPA: DUF4468 domain-containing protein [Cytophagaceae bacterium]|jgi:hypothetical protein|nr:DUF4468 domain-containing protein [Cytophagaceae bacterium]